MTPSTVLAHHDMCMPVVVTVTANSLFVCRPDIIHCHDWPTAPVCYGDKGPSKSVFTIHNLNFGADLIGRAMQAAQVHFMSFACSNHCTPVVHIRLQHEVNK